ncbi:hypothetical protein GV789_28875, partial [Nocardia cyriacigeorgica]|nr:hypothetical protein [Nocardia cyriacigeorgica]
RATALMLYLRTPTGGGGQQPVPLDALLLLIGGDRGGSKGDTIPADFDSMIAKIIAYGRDREEALGRLRRAVGETRVI